MVPRGGDGQRGLDADARVMQSLPFNKVEHQIHSIDVQPSREPGSGLALVSGALLVGAEKHSVSFSQSFLVLPEGNELYIFNDIFRVVYPS